MHLTFRNVNDAFVELVDYFGTHGRKLVRRPSRNGNVLMIDEPVLITYTHPTERVLFNAARDANPFALLYEALWMLAGRNDVDSLAYYTKQFQQYSDDGTTLNGAYGYRWRCARGVPNLWTSGDEPGKSVRGYNRPGVDQLNILVSHLKVDPNSRRAVLQMWNVEDDLLKIGGGICTYCQGTGIRDITAMVGYPTREVCVPCKGSGKDQTASKDVCCNLSVMFSLRQVAQTTSFQEKRGDPLVPIPGTVQSSPVRVLDITVTNRSNDLVWGLLGANYVCFSVLQEYMAARLGVGVGVYHHFTNNLHAYDWNFKPQEWLAADQAVGERSSGIPGRSDLYQWREGPHDLRTVPLVNDPAVFDKEVQSFVDDNGDGSWWNNPDPVEQVMHSYKEPFLMHVAQPMCAAYHQHKLGRRDEALDMARYIKADDWRIVCTSWLERRYNKKEVSQ